MGNKGNQSKTRQWLVFLVLLLRLALPAVRSAVAGAILMLCVVAVAAVVLDLAAGDNPATQTLETRLRMVLMVLVVLVAAACVGVYIRQISKPNSGSEGRHES